MKIETKYSGHCIICGIVQAGCNVTFVISSFKIPPRIISEMDILPSLGLLKSIKLNFLMNEKEG